MKSKDKIITINDELPIFPILAIILLIYLVITDVIQWQWIIIFIFNGIGDSVTFNWRKLFNKDK